MNKAIKKIELDLGGKTVNLTPEQAKNLKDALDELFGKEVIREIVHERDYTPVPYMPTEPYYRRTYPFWEWQPYRITCDVTGNYTDTMQFCADNNTLKLTT